RLLGETANLFPDKAKPGHALDPIDVFDFHVFRRPIQMYANHGGRFERTTNPPLLSDPQACCVVRRQSEYVLALGWRPEITRPAYLYGRRWPFVLIHEIGRG